MKFPHTQGYRNNKYPRKGKQIQSKQNQQQLVQKVTRFLLHSNSKPNGGWTTALVHVDWTQQRNKSHKQDGLPARGVSRQQQKWSRARLLFYISSIKKSVIASRTNVDKGSSCLECSTFVWTCKLDRKSQTLLSRGSEARHGFRWWTFLPVRLSPSFSLSYSHRAQ